MAVAKKSTKKNAPVSKVRTKKQTPHVNKRASQTKKEDPVAEARAEVAADHAAAAPEVPSVSLKVETLVKLSVVLAASVTLNVCLFIALRFG